MEYTDQDLSRRERQIMDIVFRKKKATIAEIRSELPSPPSDSAVRRMVTILEEKGYLKHEWQGPRHVVFPTMDRDTARRDVLNKVTNTYFNGSPVQAMATLLDHSAEELSPEDWDKLAELINKAREEGR